MRLWDLFEEYELAARSSNRSPNTINSMRYHVRRFAIFLEAHDYPMTCESVTPRVMREFITSLTGTYAAITVTNNVIALKTLFAFGLREELIEVDPTKRVSAPRMPHTTYAIFDNADVDVLLRACNRGTFTGLRDFAIVILLFDSGIRASELIGITDVDIDWQRGLICVLGKGSKERYVPVSARSLRVIKRYINKRNASVDHRFTATFVNQLGEPLSRSGLFQLLKRLGKRTGLHVHPHKFRHSFAVNALRNNAREFDIQDCLGHTTLTMTKHYARQSAVDLSERHKRFSPADRLKTRV